ncbi:hypothetical protein CPB86DRAFT_290180 [Serendipita vermifera]|nr:hypothetical protein CPB86DRAFT_290180 [Serendipita vermifera]
MIAQLALTEKDIQNIKMFALYYRHRITKLFHHDLSALFYEELKLLTICRLKTRIFYLSGWNSQRYNCCVNSCIAYTGIYRELADCPYCQMPRYDSKGKSATFYTLPLAPQLQALYANDGETRKSMHYTAEMLDTYQPEQYHDIHDAQAIRSLLGTQVTVNGRSQSYTYFEDRRDVPLGLMTDGFQCFK